MPRTSLDPRKRFAAVHIVRSHMTDENWAHELVWVWNEQPPEGNGWRVRYAVRYSRQHGTYIESRRLAA